MQQEELKLFIEWLPNNVEEFKDKSPEEVSNMLNQMNKSKDGQMVLQDLMTRFKESTKYFKEGGKMNPFIKKCQRGEIISTPNGDIRFDAESGEYLDVDGRVVNYSPSRIQQWIEQRRFKNSFRKDEAVRDNNGDLIIRTTYYPASADTLINNYTAGRKYNNGLARFLTKKITGSSEYDRMNEKFESLSGNEKLQKGGIVTTNISSIGEQPFTGYVFTPTYRRNWATGTESAEYRPYFKHELVRSVRYPNKKASVEQRISFDSKTGAPLDTTYVNNSFLADIPIGKYNNNILSEAQRNAARRFFEERFGN